MEKTSACNKNIYDWAKSTGQQCTWDTECSICLGHLLNQQAQPNTTVVRIARHQMQQKNHIHSNSCSHQKSWKCMHLYHNLCLEQWITANTQKGKASRCPVCRSLFKKSDVVNIFNPNEYIEESTRAAIKREKPSLEQGYCKQICSIC